MKGRIFLMVIVLTSLQSCSLLANAISSSIIRSRQFSRLRPKSHVSCRLQRKHRRLGLSSTFSQENTEADDMNHLRHLMTADSKIDRYWIHQLSLLQHGTARDLIQQLIPDNYIGYEGVTGPAKKGTLTEFYVKQKKEHPDKVILMRVGEFYETFGVDSLMLVAYCGLNTMAGKARAGCPISNVQALLNKLTDQGLSVAVYEEEASSASHKGLKIRRLSQIVFPGNRVYAHDLTLRVDNIEFPENFPVVGVLKTTSGYTVCQVYLDEQVIDVSERLTLEAVKTLLAISRYAEPIYIGQNKAKDQIIDKDILGSKVSLKIISVSSEIKFPSEVLREIASNIGNKFDNFRTRTKSYTDGPRPVYISTASQIGLIENPNVPPLVDCLLPASRSLQSAKFLSKWISSPPTHALASHMRALCSHLMTAEVSLPQCGTLRVKKVVSLLSSGQGNVALFRDIKVNIGGVLEMLMATRGSWECDGTDGGVDSSGSDSYSANGNSRSGRDSDSSSSSGSGKLKGSISSIINSEEDEETPEYYPLLPHLLAIVTSETGEQALSQELAHVCQRVLDNIDHVIANDYEAEKDVFLDQSGSGVPIEFFNKNEDPFRGKLSRKSPIVSSIYREVDKARDNLLSAIREDYPLGGVIKHDFINNMVYLSDLEKKVTKRKTKGTIGESIKTYDDNLEGEDETDQEGEGLGVGVGAEQGQGSVVGTDENNDDTNSSVTAGSLTFIRPVDRKGKPIPKKYTTQKVAEALNAYLQVTEDSLVVTTRVLETLSATLYEDVIGIKQAATWGVVLKAAADHTASSKQKDWCIPDLINFKDYTEEDSDRDSQNNGNKKFEREKIKNGNNNKNEKYFGSSVGSGHGVQYGAEMNLKDLSPYWIRRSTATLNDVELKGLFLLTAPNMSGKSTLMRSVLVTALLANCGLFVPCSTAQVPKYDHFFLRTASHDVPIEKKSAFALEMDDMRIILKDATSKSLIMIDELGKGTSARDGSALAGALLENLEEKKVAGIFATHLHELFMLPLLIPTTKYKRMGSEMKSDGRLNWTYKLEDGACTNSHALETALEYGIDESIILRAKQLGKDFDNRCRPSNIQGQGSWVGDSRKFSSSYDPDSDSDSELDSDSDTDGRSKKSGKSSGSDDVSTPVKIKYTYSLSDISTVFKELMKEQNINDFSPMTVKAKYDPPVSYEGRCCVYILLLKHMDGPDTLYVGETESIQQRLKQHRAKYKSEGVEVTAFTVTVSDKSTARRIETFIQSQLILLGYLLESNADSSHTLFSNGR